MKNNERQSRCTETHALRAGTQFSIRENVWTTGTSVSLEDILEQREQRSQIQLGLLEQYNKPLISFTLNIVGPVKVFPLVEAAFKEGCTAIKALLTGYGFPLLYENAAMRLSGCEAFFISDAKASSLKELMLSIEDTHPLGRLFDIDVLSPSKEKLSREELGFPLRTCLLCEKSAFQCGRSRTHTAEELIEREIAIMQDFMQIKYARQIAGLFTKSMTYEVTTTPKPGLVDRWHNGAHRDMDISLFMTSIEALSSYYYDCALLGMRFKGKDPSDLLPPLRKLGLHAEATMEEATNKVNTHKGLIFSGGILCAAAGLLYMQERKVSLPSLSQLCCRMLSNLSQDFAHITSENVKTHGEHLFLRYGLTGIRGEAMKGFPVVLEIGLPAFLSALQKGLPLYKSGQVALLYLITKSEDTNIITRSSYDTWRKIQDALDTFLEEHPIGTFDETEIIRQLDGYFMKNNISPGGSADLLALVYFFYFLDQYFSYL